jgi:hypothetical protein
MAKKSKHAMIVTLSGERGIHEVTRELKAAGLKVDQVMEAVGVVTGSAAPATKAKLRKVRGVSDVSADHPVDIGPPDADVS